jgi:hypothetical protein
VRKANSIANRAQHTITRLKASFVLGFEREVEGIRGKLTAALRSLLGPDFWSSPSSYRRHGGTRSRLRHAATSVGCHCNTTLRQVWVTDKIRNPQCAFEMSMFMCPAVHMSARNLQRPSSTHEPSDPPFRVVICDFRHSRRQRADLSGSTRGPSPPYRARPTTRS